MALGFPLFSVCALGRALFSLVFDSHVVYREAENILQIVRTMQESRRRSPMVWNRIRLNGIERLYGCSIYYFDGLCVTISFDKSPKH